MIADLFTQNSMTLLAQDAVRFTEWNWPQGTWEWTIILAILVGVVVWSLELYRRDGQELSLGWRIFLPTLRMLAIIGLIIVLLNPQTRTQTWADRSSRVAVLVDVSSSMQNPADDPKEAYTADNQASRAAKVIELISDSNWLGDLRKQHEVSIYTFDTALSERIATFSQIIEGDVSGKSDEEPDIESIDWQNVLQPQGAETRLGEVTAELMRELNGRTLAGIVVISDGAANAGVDAQSANDVARQLKVRLVALGTGGIEPPVNLEMAKVVSPSDVQLGDPFDIEAFVRGEGISGRTVKVELLTREPGEDTAFYPVDEQTVTVLEDLTPVQVKFPIVPTVEGEWEYLLRATATGAIQEVKQSDNERVIAVNASERPVNVLIVAGGPSWDYRFLCGTLNRHPGFKVDALLQTGAVGISQDVENVLLDFPKDKASLFEYDVLICFDPNWLTIPEESRRLFEEWVGGEGGGVIFVAGDVNTPYLSGSRDDLSEILDLHPVFLDTILPGIDLVSASTQVRPIQLTAEGEAAPLLHVNDNPETSLEFWKSFPGFYRFYPTNGPKTGALVYAKAGGVGDLTEAEPPILLASQFYGQGRTFYIGSPEFYRLRAEDPEFFERFWTRISREAAQNRLRRSNPRGSLLVDQETVRLGEMIKIRSRLLDAEFEPLLADKIDIEIETPDGRLVSPAPSLRPDLAQAGGYLGEIRAQQAGRYQIRLRVPGSEEMIRESVMAELPDLENRDLRQNIRQLQTLTAGTGGGYFPLADSEKIITLLPDSSEQFLLGEQIQTLWDRTWLMCLIVGVLGVEWLIRKLLKLA
ncbi:vWA domain-containing protein [uncultured Rubinisphaera sp.]|uniref:vWA domain-containing protein n=1 Tax=uncultured Rubinisphaera sp. TaxID=1678686 RepID=UPI0030D77B54